MNAAAKRGFRSPMDFIKAANDVPNTGSALEEGAQPDEAVSEPIQAPVEAAAAVVVPEVEPAAPTALAAGGSGKTTLSVAAASLPNRRKSATKPANVRFPEDLHDELRDFWKATDIPMSEVIIDGTRARLAELKKLYGVE